MKPAALMQRDDGEFICAKCYDVVFVNGDRGGFAPCSCIKASWGGYAVDREAPSRVPVSPGQKAALAACDAFVEKWPESKGLYLYGPTGTGKTHIARLLMHRIMADKHATAALWYVPDVISDCRSEIANSEGDGRQQQYLSDAYSVKLLVLDDFAAERATDFSRDIIAGLVNRRDRVQLPLVITSNVAPGKLADFVDGRTASRIMGLCEPVAVLGEDIRRKQARGKSAA